MISNKHDSTAFIANFEKHIGSLKDGAPDWFNKTREESLKRFEKQGIPTTKHEEWKYTDVKPIVKQSFSLTGQQKPLDQKAFDKYVSKKDINVVLINGVLSEELSNLADLPEGITITALPEALKKDGGKVKSVIDRFTTDH